jgi:hypothetical protein
MIAVHLTFLLCNRAHRGTRPFSSVIYSGPGHDSEIEVPVMGAQ